MAKEMEKAKMTAKDPPKSKTATKGAAAKPAAKTETAKKDTKSGWDWK